VRRRVQDPTRRLLSRYGSDAYFTIFNGILLAPSNERLPLDERMSATEINARIIAAPEVLGLDSRGGFRDEAVGLIGQLAQNGGSLIIDFVGTRRIDSAGLGALMLVQRQASEQSHRVVLRNLREEFRFLLVLTKLDDLFEIESNPRS
jgi:ABC-type transporter Mla MlaB component